MPTKRNKQVTFTTVKKLERIALDCKKPDQAKNFMIAEYKARLNESKAQHKVYMMREMNKKKLCLTPAREMCRSLCERFIDRARIIEEKIMKWKLKDAYKERKRLRQDMNMRRKECNNYLKSEKANIKPRMRYVMFESLNKTRRYLYEGRKKKIQFLKEKKTKEEKRSKETRKKQDDVIHGVRIHDRPLTEEYSNKPTCYGGAQLNEDEEQTLCLPPKFALYEEVKVSKCEAEIEKGMAKLRWSRWKEEEGANIREYAYNIDDNIMNFKKMRPTEMKYNKRVFLPNPMREKEEIKTLNLRNELMNEIEEYCKNNRSKMKMSNLSKEEKDGLKSLKKKSESNFIIAPTDKSSKFSIDTKENYIEAMREHVDKDEDIEESDHWQAQKEANGHSNFWTRILNVSKATGKNDAQRERNHQRAKNNLIVEGNELPPVYGLRKDHKKASNEEKGPPVRPVCSATNAYNSKLAHLINTYLANIWKNEEENCASTEELLAEFDAINEKGTRQGYFIGSADVVALYPSLDIKKVTDVVADMIKESNVTLEGVNYEEAGLYLAITRDSEDLARAGIEDLCPRRKQRLGRKPTLTGQATSNVTDRGKTWHPARKKPESKEEKTSLIAEATKVILEFLLQNHMYSFADMKKKQRKGGPIGLVLTDAITKIYMTWWDRRLKEEAEKEGIEIIMYKRYVDDISVVARIKEKERETGEEEDEENQERGETKDEMQGMKMLQRIGNRIDESIQLEVDSPSRHKDGKMPLLDVKVWIEENKEISGTEEEESIGPNSESNRKGKIMYEHYRKEIASKMTIHARSAIPRNQQRNILTQEVIRIMKNCSQELPWETKAKHLEDLSLRMQFSGHDKEMRKAAINSGLSAYKTMEENQAKGTTPLHRTRQWKRKEREKMKRTKKETWYQKGGYESTIFIPTTPNGELRKRMQRKIDQSDIKIKVIEKTGNTIKNTLHKTSITEKTECSDEECPICTTSGKKGRCRKEGITYEIVCCKCGDKYIGESGRSARARTKEHVSDLKMKRESSVLWRHCREKHDGDIQTFEYSVRDVYGQDATLRQVTEAVDIRREKPAINNKMEWGNTNLPRLTIE